MTRTRGRILTVLLCLVALTTAAGAAAAGAMARTHLQLGIQDDAVLLPGYFSYPDATWRGPRLAPARALDEAAALGVSLVKLKAQWSSLERQRGEVDMAYLSATVDLVRARGMTVMMLLTGPAPGWANPTGRTSAHRPNPQAFGRFASAVGSALAGRVESYAIWNEPNWPSSLRPRGEQAARYRWLYRRAHAALRAADPGARIVFGNLAPMGEPEPAIPPLRFLRGVLCLNADDRPRRALACPPLEADGVGLHPYTLRWAPSYPGRRDDATTGSLRRFIGQVDRYAARGVLRSPSGAALPIDLVEWAFHARSRRIPEQLRRGHTLAGLSRICRQPRVRSLIWYQLAGPPPGKLSWDTGLLTYDGQRRSTFTTLQTHGQTICPLTPPGGRSP
ncbi:MAG: hypothetical protein Q8O56_04580 [Solirubrobacteraceae bacterium]|nr:hypothetical protein [Solirubrobacteraceae bacterium]